MVLNELDSPLVVAHIMQAVHALLLPRKLLHVQVQGTRINITTREEVGIKPLEGGGKAHISSDALNPVIHLYRCHQTSPVCTGAIII